MRCIGVTILSLAVVLLTAGVTVYFISLSQQCSSTDSTTASSYRELWRPVYHFTPKINWINDPNGLIYYKGEYHMFYQYSTSSVYHVNISWGHAISTDLVRWEEITPAILADSNEEIFSGSAIVDRQNTANLGSLESPSMIAFYTGYKKSEPHYQYQSIAYSNNLGRSWTKYPTPVLDIHELEFRDPKVFKHNDDWLMLVQRSDLHHLQFYQSSNLLSWEWVGQFPALDSENAGNYEGVWECPDMFPLPVDGNKDNIKWVLVVNINPGNIYKIGSAVQYFIGDFNGTNFKNEDKENKTRWLDYGMDYYAAISFADVPNDKRIMIGWMSNWNYSEEVPTTTWKNGMTIAREIDLCTINGELMVTQKPVQNLESLRKGPVVQTSHHEITDGQVWRTASMAGEALDIEVTFTLVSASLFGLYVHASESKRTVIGFDITASEIYVDRSVSGSKTVNDWFATKQQRAPVQPTNNSTLYMRILVDANSVEVFAGQGEAVITDLVFPDLYSNEVYFFANGGSVIIEELQLWQMNQYNG